MAIVSKLTVCQFILVCYIVLAVLFVCLSVYLSVRRTPVPITTKFSSITHIVRRRVIYKGRASAPRNFWVLFYLWGHHQGAGPVLCNFGVHFYLCVYETLCYRTTKLDVLINGEGACFRHQPRPQCNGGRALAMPSFVVAFYLCV